MKRDKKMTHVLERDGIQAIDTRTGNHIALPCGLQDDIEFFEWDYPLVAVLSSQSRLGYASLAVIDVEERKVCVGKEVYFQCVNDALSEHLRKDFFDYADCKQADFLAQHID